MTNKTLLALAVSTAVITPTAQAVEFQVTDKTMFEISGTLEPSYVNVTDDNGDSTSEFTDNDSTLQFDIEHQWTPDTTGFAHIEYQWNFDEAGDENGPDDLDSAWAGIRGNYGMVRLGTSDTLYEDEIAELVDEFENAKLSDEADGDDTVGEGNQIRYVSPDFSGFSFAAEAKIEGDGEGDIVNDGQDFGDTGVGLTGVVRYDASNWGVVAGIDNRGATVVDVDGDGDTDEYGDDSTVGLGGYYDIAAFHFAARYANEGNPGDDADVDYTGVLGSYDYGPGNLTLGVQDVSPDSGDSRTELMVHADYSPFDSLELFAEVGRYDRDNDAEDRSEIGAIYSF